MCYYFNYFRSVWFLDGYIARHYQMITDFGKVIDPIADKLTQFTVAFVLVYTYSWMWLLLLIIVLKDGMLALGDFIYMKRSKGPRSLMVGENFYCYLWCCRNRINWNTYSKFYFATISIFVCIVLMLLSLVLYAKQLLSIYKELKNE